jgi:hypothetical protein
MEDAMKTYRMMAGALLYITVSTAFAQGLANTTAGEQPFFSSAASYVNIDLKKHTRNMIASLTHENDGVVESALAHATHMRLVVPEADLDAIQTTLKLVAEEGRTPVIRYKAYLGCLVFSSPAMFAQETNTEYADGDQFFSAVASRLQLTLLGGIAQ